MASASSLVGDYTEARVLAELLRLGYDPVKPYGASLGYDLGVVIGDRIARIQVKAAKWIPQRGAVQFATSSRSRTGDRKHYYGRSELIVAYCDPIGEFFAIEPQEAPPSSVRLRVRPSANGQRDGVRPADDYRLADRMQRMVHIFGSIPLVDLDDVGGRRRRRGVDPLMISCRLDLLPTRPSTLDGTRGSESLTPQPST